MSDDRAGLSDVEWCDYWYRRVQEDRFHNKPFTVTPDEYRELKARGAAIEAKGPRKPLVPDVPGSPVTLMPYLFGTPVYVVYPDRPVSERPTQ